MIACDTLVEPSQCILDEVRPSVLFVEQVIETSYQSTEQESLFVPRSDAILPVYVFMYTKSKS